MYNRKRLKYSSFIRSQNLNQSLLRSSHQSKQNTKILKHLDIDPTFEKEVIDNTDDGSGTDNPTKNSFWTGSFTYNKGLRTVVH